MDQKYIVRFDAWMSYLCIPEDHALSGSLTHSSKYSLIEVDWVQAPNLWQPTTREAASSLSQMFTVCWCPQMW